MIRRWPAGVILGACIKFCHPVLVAQHIDEDLEGGLAASLTFILRSIEVERTPSPERGRSDPAAFARP